MKSGCSEHRRIKDCVLRADRESEEALRRIAALEAQTLELYAQLQRVVNRIIRLEKRDEGKEGTNS